MKTLPVLLLLAVSGCSSRSHDFKVTGATEHEISKLHAAADKWNNEGFGPITFSDDAENTIDFLDTKIPGIPSTAVADTYVWTVDYGLGEDVTTEIRFSRAFKNYDANLLKVAMHEFGHHLGRNQEHLEPGHTMAALTRDMTEVLTPADIAYAEEQ